MNNQASNKSLYWIVGIIIVLAVGGVGGYAALHPDQPATNAKTVTLQGPSQNPMPSSAPGSSGLSNKSATSNQQLDQDLQSVQNSLNQLQQDQNTSNQDTATQSQDTPQQ